MANFAGRRWSKRRKTRGQIPVSVVEPQRRDGRSVTRRRQARWRLVANDSGGKEAELQDWAPGSIGDGDGQSAVETVGMQRAGGRLGCRLVKAQTLAVERRQGPKIESQDRSETEMDSQRGRTSRCGKLEGIFAAYIIGMRKTGGRLWSQGVPGRWRQVRWSFVEAQMSAAERRAPGMGPRIDQRQRWTFRGGNRRKRKTGGRPGLQASMSAAEEAALQDWVPGSIGDGDG